MKLPLFALRPSPLVAAVGVAVLTSFLTIKLTDLVLKDNYEQMVALQVQRDADILTRITMTGNAMGAVSALGLVNPTVKAVLKNEIPADDGVAVDTLQSILDSFSVTGVYIVRPDGMVQTNVVSIGANLNGDDVSFRPYFKRAMQGAKNVYVAISTTTGLRALYAAAPVFETQSVKSKIIGAAVIRISDDQLSKIMNRSTLGPTFLLSPQKIVFSSNQKEWFGYMAIQPTETELAAIRDLKQFGKSFLENTIKLLPFDIQSDTVNYDGRTYMVNSSTVNWNDPNGEWKLVMLADISSVMPLHTKVILGTSTGLIALLISLLMIQWRSKLVHAKAKRLKAEDELKVYTNRLEQESEIKSFLADFSIALQQSNTYTEFAKELINQIATRMGAAYITLYVHKQETQTLAPIGSYGVIENTLKEFDLGQGLLGQAAKNGQPLLLDETTNLPIKIRSGLGYGRPKAILLIPIKQNDEILGIMVLASLRGFNSTQLALQEALQPIVAVQMSILNRNLVSQKTI